MKLQKKILARMDELNGGMSEEAILPVLNELLWDSVNKYHEMCSRENLKAEQIEAKPGKEWTLVPVSADFLRVAEIRCEDWEVPVFRLYSSESEEYRRENNPYLRSKRSRPRAYLVDEDGLKIKFRGQPTKVMVVKRLTKEEDIHSRALDSVCWFVAGEIFMVFGMGEKANMSIQRSGILKE